MAEEITVKSPIDDSEVGRLPAMDMAETDEVLERLTAGAPAWAEQKPEYRGEILLKMAKVLRDRTSELADLLTREIAKTPKDAETEIVRSAELIEFTVAEYERMEDQVIRAEDYPGTKPGRVQTVTRVPLGVVLVIAPFNYPVNLSVSKIAPALQMGNTVAFKPPTQGGVTSRRMVELWQAKAGLPADVLDTITGKADQIGNHVVTHPVISGVSMTGSTNVGKHIADITGMIPLMLELGGNDPVLVLEDADIGLAAANIAKGAFSFQGQRCTAVKRVYALHKVADRLAEAIVKEVESNYGSSGDPRQHPIGPVISDKQADYLDDLLGDAKHRGGRIIRGGKRDGRVFEATVVDSLPGDARLVTEEQFGPLLPIVRVNTVIEAVKQANNTHYGLQASVFTADAELADSLAAQLEAGGVHLNGPDQRGPDNFMFVGHKDSGITAQGARFALEAMSQLKGIVHNS